MKRRGALCGKTSCSFGGRSECLQLKSCWDIQSPMVQFNFRLAAFINRTNQLQKPSGHIWSCSKWLAGTFSIYEDFPMNGFPRSFPWIFDQGAEQQRAAHRPAAEDAKGRSTTSHVWGKPWNTPNEDQCSMNNVWIIVDSYFFMVNPWHEDDHVRLFDHEFMMVFLFLFLNICFRQFEATPDVVPWSRRTTPPFEKWPCGSSSGSVGTAATAGGFHQRG